MSNSSRQIFSSDWEDIKVIITQDSLLCPLLFYVSNSVPCIVIKNKRDALEETPNNTFNAIIYWFSVNGLTLNHNKLSHVINSRVNPVTLERDMINEVENKKFLGLLVYELNLKENPLLTKLSSATYAIKYCEITTS